MDKLYYGGIGLIIMLLALFFLFENSLFHKTRARERLYLSFTMIVAYLWILLSTIYYETEMANWDGEGHASYDEMVQNHPFVQYLPETLEFTTITLIATFALLNVVPTKVNKFTGSWPLDERHITPSYSAKRKVKEINMLLEMTEKHSNFAGE